MPPPPPPSASYNLNLDDFSDSSEEEENDFYSHHHHRSSTSSSLSSAAQNNNAVHKTDGYLVKEEDQPTTTATVVSLSELRQRYANGTVSKEEFAAALRAHQANTTTATAANNNHDDHSDERMMMVDGESEPEVVEAFNVTALSEDDSDHDDDDDDASSSKMDIDGQRSSEEVISSPVRKKEEEEKEGELLQVVAFLCHFEFFAMLTTVLFTLVHQRFSISMYDLQKKKKKANANNSDSAALTNESNETTGKSDQNDTTETDPTTTVQSTPTKSISFGTISVREYARTIGTHVVPADGGYPLGLSTTIVTEHNNTMDDDGRVISTMSSPMKEAIEASSPSPSSPSPSKQHHHHRHHDYHGWTIDDFESRKQLELQQRYTQLIHDQRKRNFEKKWEKKHYSQLHSKHQYNTRNKGGGGRQRSGSFSGSPSNKGGGRQRSGSFSGGGSGGGSSGGKNRKGSSGYCKMEMNEEEKQELEQLLAKPVIVPDGVLETRPYDYKKKLPSNAKGGSGGSNSKNAKRDDFTEEEELLHNYRGRNPLFGLMKEDERRRVLQRDDHLIKLSEELAENSIKRSSARKMQEDDNNVVVDHLDPVFTQHVQHDLESLRIERSDPTNLGCSCRKLHVFLPGEADKSHQKKKKSHRRMNERKVREELRKRGLLHKGNSDMSREKMEKMLHDAIENEPCCWGGDCPCVRNGVGCQADTCSCWHASHDVPHTPTKKEADSDPKKVGESDVEAIERRCGNANGMYVVNMKEIKEYRQQFVTTQNNVEV